MMRTLPIAASLALATAGFTAFAQDPATDPATEDAAAAPAAMEEAEAPAAQVAATATAAGDAARGRMLTYTCQGCHGIEGYQNAYPNFHVPKIGGQSAAYLANALTEYKEGTRQHPTMQAQAQSFSEQDIADIAAFLSSLKQ